MDSSKNERWIIKFKKFSRLTVKLLFIYTNEHKEKRKQKKRTVEKAYQHETHKNVHLSV